MPCGLDPAHGAALSNLLGYQRAPGSCGVWTGRHDVLQNQGCLGLGGHGSWWQVGEKELMQPWLPSGCFFCCHTHGLSSLAAGSVAATMCCVLEPELQHETCQHQNLQLHNRHAARAAAVCTKRELELPALLPLAPEPPHALLDPRGKKPCNLDLA